MSSLPQVPRMTDVLTPAFDALDVGLTEQARLERNRHANHGRLGDILRGFRGQGEVAKALLTREIIATRLIDANGGQPLRDLAASEYFAKLGEEPQYAIGELNLSRTKVNTSSSPYGNFLPGVIVAGQRFTRPQSAGDIPLSEADFLVTEDVACSPHDTVAPTNLNDGTWQHYQAVTVPIVAANPGPLANTERVNVLASPPRNLFDSALPAAERLQAGTIFSAGGQVGVSDGQIIDFAKAMAQGFYGANTAAALAGARTDPRVRRVASALDYRTAILWLYAADSSWASSAAYRNSVKQGMFARKWVGFGGRIAIGSVYNVPITVDSTIYLRSKLFAAEKTALTQKVREALQGYFDNRADFYTWHITSVGGAIATADARILTAEDPQVLSGGVALSEPPATIAGGSTTVPHYSLRALNLTIADPGS